MAKYEGDSCVIAKEKSMYSVNSSPSNTMGGNGGAEDAKRAQGIARGE